MILIDIEKRRLEISEELNIPIDKVIIYPYRGPKTDKFPSDNQIKQAKRFMAIDEEGIKCDKEYTHFETIHRQEDVIEWLKNTTSGNKHK